MSKRNKDIIGVTFECRRAYVRYYIDEAGKTFAGLCPICTVLMQVRVSTSG
jgi:hypothetical protein